MPWRRPGFQLGLDIAAVTADQPAGDRLRPRRPRHHRLGRDAARSARRTPWRSSAPPRSSSPRTERLAPRAATRSGRCARASSRCPTASGAPGPPRSPRSSAAWPPPTPRRSATSPTPTSSWTSSPARSSPRWPRWAPPARTTSCAPRSGRWSLDLPAGAPLDEVVDRLRELHAAYREDYAAYYARHATADSPPMRGADPAIVLVPGVGHVLLRRGQADRPGGRGVLRQRHQRHARRRGHLHLRPDRRRRRSSASSTGRWRRPSSRRLPAPEAAGHPGRPGHRRRLRASAGPSPQRLAAEGACVVVADLDLDGAAAGGRRARRAGPAPSPCAPTSPTRTRSPPLVDAAALAFGGVDLVVNNAGLSISKPLLETTDRGLGPPARRHGPRLLPRLPRGRPGDDRPGHGRRHRLHRLARTPCSPARTTSPTARPRPTRPTRSGCSPPSSASTASASTASTPTAWSAAPASSPAAGAPSAPRSTASGGVRARRVLRPAHPAQARGAARARGRRRRSPSPAATSSQTTGLHIPVDSGRRRRVPAMSDLRRRRPRRLQRPGHRRPARRTAGSLTEEVARFPNAPVAVPAGSGHAALGRAAPVRRRPRRPARPRPRPGRWPRVGIDSWAVDYGLLDADGALLGNPVHYRDARTDGVPEKVFAARPGAGELYARTGLQVLPFNTVFQLAAARGTAAARRGTPAAAHPRPARLLAHRRAGRRGHQRLHHRPARRHAPAPGPPTSPRRCAARSACRWPSCCPPLVEPGHRRRPAAADGRRAGLRGTAAGRASAPTTPPPRSSPCRRRRPDFAYISCGTWSLVGVELDAPGAHRGEPARPTSPTSSASTARCATCATSWGCGCCRSACAPGPRRGERRRPRRPSSRRPPRCPALGCVVDVDDPAFLPPGDMPARIAAAAAARRAARRRPGPGGRSPAASSTASPWPTAAPCGRPPSCAGREVDVVHLVGGGARNALLCQLTADATGLPVVAGPVEGAALGNLLVQARAVGDADRRPGRSCAPSSPPPPRPAATPPRGDDAAWAAAERRLAPR